MKFKYGTMATVVTAVFIAVIILINITVDIAGQRFTLKMDLTKKQTFTLGADTIKFLEKLDQKTEIIIIGDEQAYRKDVTSTTAEGQKAVSPTRFIVETTDNYVRQSSNVSVIYVDPRYNPNFFKERAITLDDGTGVAAVVVIYSPDTKRYRLIKNSIFNDMQYVGLERRITSGLLYVTKADLQLIGIMSGHQEDELPYLQVLLEDNGFDVGYIDIREHDVIPSKVQMLVISNPTRGYSVEDIRKLDEYLRNDEKFGKQLMVFFDHDTPYNEHLQNYLADEWGIEFSNLNIFDPKNSSTMTNVYYPFLKINYANPDLAGTLSNNKDYMYVQLGKARPVVKKFDNKDEVSVYSLLASFDTSFGRDTDVVNMDPSVLKSLAKEANDAPGPFDMAVMAKRTRFSGMTEFSSCVYAGGSLSFVDDYFLSNVDGSQHATSEYLLRVIAYTGMVTETIDNAILPKSLIPDALSFTDNNQVMFVFLGFIFGVPALLGLLAFLVWRHRRYL